MIRKKPTALVLLVLLLLTGVAITGCVDESEAENTPKETMRNYITKIDEGDAQGAMNYTDIKFNETLYEEYTGGNQTQDIELTINSLEVTHKDEMDSVNKSYMEDAVPKIEENLSVEIEDYCSVKANITYEGDNQTNTGSNSFVLLKIDSKWYVSLYISEVDTGIEQVNVWANVDGSKEDNVICSIVDQSGEATINGTAYLQVEVLDADGDPMEGLKVTAEGCGVDLVGTTNESGMIAENDGKGWRIDDDVHLPPNVDSDKISIEVEFNRVGGKMVSGTSIWVTRE